MQSGVPHARLSMSRTLNGVLKLDLTVCHTNDKHCKRRPYTECQSIWQLFIFTVMLGVHWWTMIFHCCTSHTFETVLLGARCFGPVHKRFTHIGGWRE